MNTTKEQERQFLRAITESTNELTEQKAKIIGLIHHDFEWSKPFAFSGKRDGVPGKHGVYRINYIPEDSITKYIGQTSNVGARRNNHRSIYENKGQPILYVNSSKDSDVARKMYDYDPDIDNWEFQYSFIPNKILCQKFEYLCISDEEPEFNNKKNAGKG